MRHMIRKHTANAALAAATALAFGFALPTPAGAQQAGGLTESLKTLESSPRDLDALLTAGRETLEIGDLPSAAAFFGRAAEVSPGDPRVLAGLGTLAAYMNQPDKALDYFARASGAGSSNVQIGAGRGLAFDLTGNREAAEVNYRAALTGPEAQAAARRLALNLAMAGDRAGAIALINPQIASGDGEALRARAFILALTGDTENARRAIESAMPGSGDAIEPFLRMLPRLSDRQKAAAVHLGVFPTENEVEYAGTVPARNAETSRPQARPTTREAEPVAVASRSSNPERDRLIEQVGRSDVVTDVPEQRSSPRYRLIIPTDAQARAGAKPRRVRIDDDPAEVISQSRALERSTPIETTTRTSEASSDGQGRLASIDQLLANDPAATPEPVRPRIAEVAVPAAPTPKYDAPPPPRPKYDAPPAPTPKVEAPRPAASVARAAASDIGVEGTHFVQLAGSDDRGAMSYEWRRIAGRANGALSGRDALLTRGASFHRLLVGPFETRTEAQEMVNRLRAQGVDSFAWTRNPSQLRIDRL